MIVTAVSANDVGGYDCLKSRAVPKKLSTAEGYSGDARTKDNENNDKIFMVMLAHPACFLFNVASAFCWEISIFLSYT